ncbi:MAG: phage portal protein [Glaciecola sp.]
MKQKPKITVSQAQLLSRASQLMANAQNSMRSGFLYSGGDYMADAKHDKAWKDYGWPATLTNFMFWNMWRRNAIAAQVISLPVKLCWMTKPCVKSSDDEHEETQFEKEIAKLVKRLKLWQRLKGGDLRQRVGRYGALVWTVADGKTMDKPLERVNSNRIVSIKPVFESQLDVTQQDDDPTSPRYGQPLYYTLQEHEEGARSKWQNKSGQIHWTRVTPLAEGADDGTIYGIPALEAIFNDLIDWDKIKGSGGEGFWRAAAQKFVLQASKESNGSAPKEHELDALTEMLAEMFAGFDSMPYTGGWELKSLDTSMPNPEHFVGTLEKSIAAGSGIPNKVLFGSQSGVKAGDEDTGLFMRLLQSRRENELTDMIEDVMNWLAAHTEITLPEELHVEWDDLTAPDAAQKAELAKAMSIINKDAVTTGQDAPFKPNEIRTKFGADSLDELDDIDMGESELDGLDDAVEES